MLETAQIENRPNKQEFFGVRLCICSVFEYFGSKKQLPNYTESIVFQGLKHTRFTSIVPVASR